MTRARILVLSALALTVPGGARAACETHGRLICGSGAPQITSDAALQVSRGGSFAPAASGAVLRGGDRVLAGDGAARLALGPSCSAPVAAGALVSISRRDGRTCASVTSPSGASDGPAVTGALEDRREIPTGLLIGAGGAAAAGALALGFGLTDSANTSALVPTISAR